MLVLSTRLNDKIHLPDIQATIEVVAIQSGTIRLGISAPESVRVLREGIPDRVAEWGPAPEDEGELPTLQNIKRLIDKRLEIAREGLSQARQRLRDGFEEDARVLMEKVDEDLHLLRRRVRREIEKADSPCGIGI
jgi:carbon storage regulator CsrA